jgi:hypothetical protein
LKAIKKDMRKAQTMRKKIWITVVMVALWVSFTNVALGAALQAYAPKTGDDVKTFEPRRTACADLNGDGIRDALVLLQGPYWCATGGCTLLVFKSFRDGFTFISKSTLIPPPLLASNARTKGWRDLVVEVSGGGMAPKKVALKFNGSTYPLNPSVQPALPKNTCVSGETVFKNES